MTSREHDLGSDKTLARLLRRDSVECAIMTLDLAAELILALWAIVVVLLVAAAAPTGGNASRSL